MKRFAKPTKILQIVSTVFAVALLVWLLERVGWTTIAATIGRVGFVGVAALGLLGLAETVLDSAALVAVAGPRLRLRFAAVVNSAGALLNLVLPWESGEVLKTALLHTQFGSHGAVSSMIIWNTIYKLSRPAVSALTAVLAWMLCRQTSGATIALVCSVNVLAFLPYLVLRVLVQHGAAETLVKIMRLVPGVRRHPDHWLELARNVDREVRQFWQTRRGDYLKAFAYQAVARSTAWFSIYVGFRLIGLPYGFAEATLVYATMNVAEYVIAILPARVGVAEGTAYFAFQVLGLDPALGLVLYVVLRVRTVCVNGLLAPWAFVGWERGTPAAARNG